MLTYRVGSANFGLSRYLCPELTWLGLSSADVDRLQDQNSGDWLQDSFQVFGERDTSVLKGLLKRPVVQQDSALVAELTEMQKRRQKLEIEALYSRGPDFITRFLRDGVLNARQCAHLPGAAA